MRFHRPSVAVLQAFLLAACGSGSSHSDAELGSGGSGFGGAGGSAGSGTGGAPSDGGGGTGAQGGAGALGGAGGGGAAAGGASGSAGAAGTGASGGGGSAGAGGSNPYVDALLDPNRPSLAYECSGTPLTEPELIALFAPGRGRAPFCNLTQQALEEQCHPVTGCSGWKPVWSDADDFGVKLDVTATGALTLTPQDATCNQPGVPLSITEGDAIYQSKNDGVTWVRMRFTKQADGKLCWSAATPLVQLGSGAKRFSVGQMSIGPSTASGSGPNELPVVPGESTCAEPPASNAAITSAWFDPGQSQVWMLNPVPFGAQRECHPQTGCSKWYSDSTELLLTHLKFDAQNQLGIDVEPYGSGAGKFFLLQAGVYQGTFATQFAGSDTSYEVSGKFGLGCAELTAKRTVPNEPESFEDFGPDVTRHHFEQRRYPKL